jgi:MSHA biogenesis protein MshJ
MIFLKINSCSAQQRIFIALAGCAAIALVFYVLFFANLSAKTTQIKQDIAQTQAQIDDIQEALSAIDAQKKPTTSKNTELAFLRQTLKARSTTVLQYQHVWINQAQAPALLNDLVADFKGLQLIDITTLPAVGLEGALYRQTIQISLKGQYEELLAYVRKIESLAYPLRWEKLEYTIIKFPQAKIILTLSTLSETPNWIGGIDAEKN